MDTTGTMLDPGPVMAGHRQAGLVSREEFQAAAV